VKAVGFVERDVMPGSRYLTPFRIILATILNFLYDILQNPAPGFYELLPAGWAQIHFLSAGVADVVTILAHRNGWPHVPHTYRALELCHNLPPIARHLSVARSILC